MGIENFFNTIIQSEKFDKLELINKEIKCEYLFIDFNSIIYIISNKVEYEINYYLYSLIINEKDDYTAEIEKLYNINLNSVGEFKNYFTPNIIEELVKNQIYEYIKDLCRNLKDKDNIQDIYISFDGTATMAKIAEQKRRKYINYILSSMKNVIYKKYENTIDEASNIYYDNFILFNKKNTNILTGQWANHIQDIYNNLESFEYKTKLKNICPNIKNIIISSPYEFGEGEKKILEFIMQHKKEGSYIIYSPDSDSIIISLIIQNKLIKSNINTSFTILKDNKNYNKDEEDYVETISIDNIRQNIINVAINKFNTYRKYNHNINNIIDDIAALFTFFGNDFLPKIESLNGKNGIEIIIDIYIKYFNKSRLKNPYILYEENNITKINYNALKQLISIVSTYEDKMILDKYISMEYRNYNYILNILNNNTYSPFFIDKINRYCHGFNKLVRYIKEQIIQNKEVTCDDIYTNIINHFTDKDSWLEQFKILENFNNQFTNINDIITNVITYVKTNNYKSGLKLIKYTNTVNDKYHQKKINENKLHPKMNISKYDIEIYKLEKKLDEYENIGNLDIQDNYNIGITEVKYKDCEYKIHVDQEIEEKKDFFYKHIMECESSDDIESLVFEYIKGFFWTIDFYFNKINRQVNINNICTWSYSFNHAPYFTEINSVLEMYKDNFTINKIFYQVHDINSFYYVKPSEFMNTLEQYLYITPKVSHTNIPESYKQIIEDENLFPNIDDIAERVLNGDNNLIETYNSKHLNRANIIKFKKCNYNFFMNKMINLRVNINNDYE